MKIVQINSVPNGSTGKIMFALSKTAEAAGIEARNITGIRKSVCTKKYDKSSHFIVQTLPEYYVTCILGRLTGKPNFVFSPSTKRIIRIIRDYHPDIVHLHNIHGDFIQTEELLSYLNKNNYRIVWTFHDCWPFTGRCPHFVTTGCDKWKYGCIDCPYPNTSYPAVLRDRGKEMWTRKRNCVTSNKHITIVTPSKWLAELVGESFLRNMLCKSSLMVLT